MSRAYGYTAHGGAENETWFDRAEPEPGPSELMIEVRAAGVNPIDHKIRSGLFADPAAEPSFPLVLGVEAAGVVRAVGADVSGFAVGDEVLGKVAPGHGTFAEHAVLRAADCTVKPVKVSFIDAAALPVAGRAAWDALGTLEVTKGETLLINGVGGGVGVIAAQLARDRGITVFGTGSEAKRSLAESLDATLIRYDDGDVVEQMRAVLPGGVDAIVDLVGGDSMRHVAILVGGDPGRVLSIADPSVTELGGRWIAGGFAGVAELAEMVAEGKLDPKVLQTYPFDETPQAMRAVESGHALGKIVIDLGQETRT